MFIFALLFVVPLTLWVLKDTFYIPAKAMSIETVDCSKKSAKHMKKNKFKKCVSPEVFDLTIEMFEEVENGNLKNNKIQNGSNPFDEEKSLCVYSSFLNKSIFSIVDRS